MRKKPSIKAASLILMAVLSLGLLSLPMPKATYTQSNLMTFTSGNSISFHSPIEMEFWSGEWMRFGTGITIQFLEAFPDTFLAECETILILFPPGWIPPYCSWWEILDPAGNPTGLEFHVDGMMGPDEFHVDATWPPGGVQLPYPPGTPISAAKKVDQIAPCDYFEVHWPADWYPEYCSWWEIIEPESGNPTGFEFHVDWTNESCEFHVGTVIPGPYFPPFPSYEIEARRKITIIQPCDWFYVLKPGGFNPDYCSWWEILDPAGNPTGLEFHVDESDQGIFHVDEVLPGPVIEVPPYYPTKARKKIDVIQPCETFVVDDPTTTPTTCTWWKVISPDIGDVEFHVDQYDPVTGEFHIDEVFPEATPIRPTHAMKAEEKIDDIQPCDWFKVVDPDGYLPTVCSWWRIVSPPQWAGVVFHIDSTDGIDRFHVDLVDPLEPGPTPPPYAVTAEEIDPWVWKRDYPDYAPAGVPDFDQRQWGTYNWTNIWGAWSHCGPVAVANSLWWLDSEFETNTVPPPAIIDTYRLVTAYGVWDDHDPRNVAWLVEHLAYLMDTDGRRTGIIHSGTDVHDMEAGLAHYLSWTGINPPGDVNGDGEVDATDLGIVAAAMGTVPGMAGWNMAADVSPASTTYPPVADNIIDAADFNLVQMNLGAKGLFYEHTVMAPDFGFIEEEVEKCQDVVLLIGYWIYDPTGGGWYREEGGHYVTVAGVNSPATKIAISDPVQDAFENGLIPEGRIPFPHIHMPPEPPYVTHNDAALVSQDIYDAMIVSPPFPPCPGGNWMLANFASWRPAPPFFAVIEAAVVTSPLGVHDVAVTDVKSSKDGCLPIPNVGQNKTVRIYATVENQGTFVESFFDVTVYATDLLGSYEIGSQTLTLLPNETTVLTFVWDTTGYARGNYTLSAVADTVPGETEVIDNSYTDGTLWVNLIGDINGDDYVGIDDLFTIASHFAQDPSHPDWNPNCDLNDDDYIGIDDVFEAASHFGEEGP